MFTRHENHRLRQVLVLALAATLAIGWGASAIAAGELDKLDTSLRLIPADAAFYSSMLRNREQFDAIAGSNAWAKIKSMPVVQMGLSLYQQQSSVPGSGPANLAMALKNPEVRKILDLLADMASNEIFLYGDEDCIDFVELVQYVVGALRYGPVLLQATGQAKELKPGQAQARAVISVLAEHVDLIGLPSLVVGFRLKNANLGREQLVKLEMMANIVLESNPRTQGHFKKTKVGNHEYLVLELDGGMVPWDELPMQKFKEAEAEEGDAQKIIDRLKQSKLVLALGMRDDYLLCSIGSSLDCLEKLGSGQRLVDRPEFKPLEKSAGRRLVSIGYLSAEMNQQLNNQAKNLDDMLDLADELLPLAKLDKQQEERVRNDLESLAEDLKTVIPEVGATMGLSYLCDRGVEGYQYAWGQHGQLDGAKPLGLLEHVGGSPILGAVVRQKVSIKNYDLAVKWVKKGYGYFREIGLPNVPAQEREKAEKFLDAALPFVARMDQANRELLFPALADGQVGLVIDGRLQSKRFLQSLPATERPMPMVEPAIVVGVSDAKRLKQAMSEYRAVVNGLIDALRQTGANVPEQVRIPEPQVTESSLGTCYSFNLPKEWGVDEQIAPNIGVSDQVAVVSASRQHTERLMKAAPLSIGGVLAKTDRPLAAAVWFNWIGLVQAATPWVDFAVERALASKGGDDAEKKSVADQVRVAVDVLKVLRSITNETYLEDDALVHHTLVEIQDVAK